MQNHLPFSYLFSVLNPSSHLNFDTTSEAVVNWSSWMRAELLVKWRAWTLMTPSCTSGWSGVGLGFLYTSDRSLSFFQGSRINWENKRFISSVYFTTSQKYCRPQRIKTKTLRPSAKEDVIPNGFIGGKIKECRL